jgi:hypothetical protein
MRAPSSAGLLAYRRLAPLGMLLTTLALGACGDSGGGGGGGGGTTTFVGIVSASTGGASGSITLVAQTASPAPPSLTGPALVSPVAVTGVMEFLGSAISLTGTYDPTTSAMSVTGSGYTFDGVFDGVDGLEGTWTGPNATSGTFVTTLSSTAIPYCGIYTADDQSDDGTFSFVIDGTHLRGEAVSSSGGNESLEGVVANNQITIYFPGTQITLATGTRSGSNVSGTYDDGQGTTGTWSGGVCQ